MRAAALAATGVLLPVVIAKESDGQPIISKHMRAFLDSRMQSYNGFKTKTYLSNVAPKQRTLANGAEAEGDFYVEIVDTDDVFYTSEFAFGANL